MRNISFFLTQQQIRDQAKTVTRRLGWLWLVVFMKTNRVGPLLQPVVKGQGIPRGGHVELIEKPIRILTARLEPLNRMSQDVDYGFSECIKEGFPDMFPSAFVDMFCAHNACEPDRIITRIGFEYTFLRPRMCALENKDRQAEKRIGVGGIQL